MYRVACVSRAGNTGAAVVTAGFAIALMVAGAEPAYAIPSPELVVGSLSSISQLIALGSAILGGGVRRAGFVAREGRAGLALAGPDFLRFHDSICGVGRPEYLPIHHAAQ